MEWTYFFQVNKTEEIWLILYFRKSYRKSSDWKWYQMVTSSQKEMESTGIGEYVDK